MPINTDIVLERFQAGFNIWTRGRNQCSGSTDNGFKSPFEGLPVGFNVRWDLEGGAWLDAIFLGGALFEL